MIIGFIFSIVSYYSAFGWHINFLDTDDHMRMVRIREFFTHFDLSNNVIARSNVPFGCSLHWTRFYDFFIIIPSYLLNFFTDSINNAIEYVCFCISPIVKCISIAILFKIVCRILKKYDANIVASIFLAHVALVNTYSFGRPDHHAFIILFELIFTDAVVRIVCNNFNRTKDYVLVSLISALCIWISPETLIPIAIVNALFFFLALGGIGDLQKLLLQNIMTALFVGIIILDSISKIEYDKISIVHFSLFTCASIFLGICVFVQNIQMSIFAKLSIIGLGLICVAAVFLATYPKFLRGMEADISDYVKLIWLSKISEMKPVFASNFGIDFAIYAIIILVAVSRKIYYLANRRFCRLSIVWSIFILNTIFYTIFAFFSVRMLPFSILFSLPLLVDLGMNSRNRRIIVTFFITIGVFFTSATVDSVKSVFAAPALTASLPSAKCERCACNIEANSAVVNGATSTLTVRELYKEIDNLSDTPVVIMASSNDGPKLLYYTKHSVLGAPYHRQQEGIISSYKVMQDAFSEKTVGKILLDTNASYIFIKKSAFAKRAISKAHASAEHASLANMIVHNTNIPPWITIVKLSEKFDNIIIAKINKEMLIERLKQ
ncbi:hypothetical protein FACS189449_08330 [Alphaproteobacteria bacterium]|nr:hypothetical protein FACS189449_08330 [Alphaproteobacteria bacterium]